MIHSVRVLFILAVWAWITHDSYVAVKAAPLSSMGMLFAEPIFWHKLGILLVSISIGISLLQMPHPDISRGGSFLTSFAGQRIILVAVLSLVTSWGMRQDPRGDVTTWMVYVLPLLFIVGVGVPSVLRLGYLNRAGAEASGHS